MPYPHVWTVTPFEDNVTDILAEDQIHHAVFGTLQVTSLPTPVTGTATATSAWQVLKATWSTFVTSGVVAWDVVYNTSDVSFAIVKSVDSETQITTTPLKWGTLNAWASGNTFSVKTCPFQIVTLVWASGGNQAGVYRRNSGNSEWEYMLTVTSRNISNSTILDSAIANLDESLTAHKDSGFASWGSGTTYYTITGSGATGALQIDRAGAWYIQWKKVTWTAPQTTAAFADNTINYVYINSSGIIGSTTSASEALYQDNIVLFQVYDDGTNHVVVRENHPYSFDEGVSRFMHFNFGSLIGRSLPTDTAIGADITRVATGTGGAAGDRQIKIVGAAKLFDHGIEVDIPDSAGAAVTWNVYYTDGSGNWKRYAQQTGLPMFWNSAGTPTALTTTTNGDVGVYRLFVSKDDLNSSTPTYFAVMNTANFNNAGAADTAIATSPSPIATASGQLAGLELAQLGYAVVQNNGSGGYIDHLNIMKTTATTASSGGGGGTAALVTTDTSTFNGALSAADTSVQLALNTLDDVVWGYKWADIASAATTSIGSATWDYVVVTWTTGITSFGTGNAGMERTVTFSGALTITHNATSLILPGSANITTAAGDTAKFRSIGSTDWKCVSYEKFDGKALSSSKSFGWNGSDGAISGALTITGSNDTYIVKNYTDFAPGANSVTITPTGCVLHIKVSGNLNLTWSTLNFAGKWKTWGAQAAFLAAGNAGNRTTNWLLSVAAGWGQVALNNSRGGSGGGGGASLIADGTVGVSANWWTPWAWGTFASKFEWIGFVSETSMVPRFVPQWGGSGGGGSSGGAGSYGWAGGNWGGLVIFEVAGNVTFSSTTITVAGAIGSAWQSGNFWWFGAGGGGGGGGGGIFALLYNGTLSGSNTPTVTGWSGGAGWVDSAWGWRNGWAGWAWANWTYVIAKI